MEIHWFCLNPGVQIIFLFFFLILYFEYGVCVIHLSEFFSATVKAKLVFTLHFSKQLLPVALTLVEQYWGRQNTLGNLCIDWDLAHCAACTILIFWSKMKACVRLLNRGFFHGAWWHYSLCCRIQVEWERQGLCNLLVNATDVRSLHVWLVWNTKALCMYMDKFSHACPFSESKQGSGSHLGDTGTWYSSHPWRSHHSLWHPSLLLTFTDHFRHSEEIKGDWMWQLYLLFLHW